MFKSTKFERLIARAATAFLLMGCFTAPAWATYGGGACHTLHARAGDRDPVRGGVARPPGGDRLPDRL